jgi:hypothetical protein
MDIFDHLNSHHLLIHCRVAWNVLYVYTLKNYIVLLLGRKFSKKKCLR